MKFPRSLAIRIALPLVLATLPIASLVPVSAQASGSTVNVVGYSVVKTIFSKLETAFQATSAGSGVNFSNSFGASDTQTNNVANGQSADLVNLSYTPNIGQLVTAGKVPSDWASQEFSLGGVNVALTGSRQQTTYPTPGILTDSAVVFVVRAGNPLKIGTSWLNLVKPYTTTSGSGKTKVTTKHTYGIVTPNPTTSGSARWNLIAAYAGAIGAGDSSSQAQSYLKSLLTDTVAQPVSGSAALAAFLGGTGDVLLSYEDDALAAVAAGDAVQIIYPSKTILIENPVALTKTGLSNPAAKAFYSFLFSTAGQTILAQNGFRPVLKSVWKTAAGSFHSFGASATPITTFDPSGWTVLNGQFFDPSSGIVSQLEQSIG